MSEYDEVDNNDGSTLAFNSKFRRRVIALLLSRNWWVRHANVIKPGYFENKAEEALVESILGFYKEYSRPPAADELEQFLTNTFSNTKRYSETEQEETFELKDVVYDGLKTWDLDFARDEIKEFARRQRLYLAIASAADQLSKNNFDGIEEQITKALASNQEEFKHINLVRDVEGWLGDLEYEEKIMTGIFHLDRMLEGGAARGELGVVIAPPNAGKSMALVNIGWGAATIASDKNVAHVTLEISEAKTAKRYAARTAFYWYDKKADAEEYKERFLKQAKRLLKGEITIMGAAPGTIAANDLRRYLDNLILNGFKPDVLVVDYDDEMKLPPGNNTFEVHGKNYTLLKQIAVDYNITVWTAAQTNRMSMSKLTIDMDDMAESFKKAAKADIVLAVCQSKDEKEVDLMRFFCAKNRDGAKHWYVQCKEIADAHALVSKKVLWNSDLKA